MAWTSVSITGSTTIAASELNGLRGNAQYLRADLVGRVLATACSPNSAVALGASHFRLRFDLGPLAWFTGWTYSTSYVGFTGNVTNLDTTGIGNGVSELVVTAETGGLDSAPEYEIMRIPVFVSTDIRRISFLGTMRMSSNRIYVGNLTVLGAHASATIATS